MKCHSIFNREFNDLSTPQKNWKFGVEFYRTTGTPNEKIMNNFNAMNIPCNVDLPKYENKTVTRWFMGQPRTDVINRDYTGTTSISWQLRSSSSECLGLFDFLHMIHSEFGEDLSHVELSQEFDKVVINLIGDCNGTKVYTLYNCVIQSMDMDNLDAAGSGDVKIKVTLHYDYWTVTTTDETMI